MTYQSFETSATQGLPQELYVFTYQAQYLRFTSGARAVTFNGASYVPYPIQRSNFSEKSGTFEDTLTVTAAADFAPGEFFRAQPLSAVMSLAIYRRHKPDDPTSYVVVWMGRVLGATWDSEAQVALNCETDLSSLKRLLLRRKYQRGCPWPLYGHGCNLNPANFAFPSTVFGVSGFVVSSSAWAGLATDYFAGGYIEYTDPNSGVFQSIAIDTSTTGGDLTLVMSPIGLANAVGVIAYPGCDHTFNTCHTKFDNRLNYGGQPSIPDINPMGGAALY